MHPWQYCADLNQEGNDIRINIQVVVPPEIQSDLQHNQVEAEVKSEASGNQEDP